MKNTLFISLPCNSLSKNLIYEIVQRLKSNNAICVRDLTFGIYFNGLREYNNRENGIYFFRFEDDTYYVGLAASCTFIERLSKHVDGRVVGTFNSVLKRLNNAPKEMNYFLTEQEKFSKATVLFMPIAIDEVQIREGLKSDPKSVNKALEIDYIYFFKNQGFNLINRRLPKKLSNYFVYE